MKQKIKLLLKNSLSDGKVFYGLHMSEGIATYKPPGEKPFTVFVGERAIKLMNSSFPGKPVYVGHTDDRGSLDKADGVVVESFYNKADGKHWAKFVVTTQKGIDAINRGWRLSNSFLVDDHIKGGCWHGHDFDKEVTGGTYDHLAIVDDPRYAESIILTPEEFKKYNNEKEAELLMLANSKEKEMKFQLFKKTKVDNSKDLNFEEMSVTLPKSGKEKTLLQLVNEADEAAVAVAPSIEDAKVTVGGVEMTVKELIKMYSEMKASLEEVVEETEEGEEESDETESEDESETLHNELEEDEEDEEESEEIEDEEAEEVEAPAKKLDNSKKVADAKKAANLKKLRLANENSRKSTPVVADMVMDQVTRGSSRYGSKK